VIADEEQVLRRDSDHNCRWPCVQCVEQFANGSAIFLVSGHFSTPLENWTVRAFWVL